jgi:hypothetical protein
MKSYYEILGVSQTSDEETITAAFKALMQKLDSGTDSATAAKGNTKDFNDGYAVLKAYEVLVDPDGRREYDASLIQTKPQVANPPSPEIPVVAEEEDVVVFTRANSFAEQQPSRWNRALWILPLLLVGFFLNSQIKNSTDPNEIVTVTVNGTANARAQPTAEGSSVLDTYDVGTELSGTWIDGEPGTNERWLKFEVAGQTRYVWDGNLSAVKPVLLKAPQAPLAVIDTAKEMRSSGWEESSPDGDGCSMERRGERENGLNYIFIYADNTYELSFSSPKYKNNSGTTENVENTPWSNLAVLFDGHRVPAVLQNHYANFWEVEVPLTTEIRRRLARASSISLQLGSETIAEEKILPNPTSIATIERCLKP